MNETEHIIPLLPCAGIFDSHAHYFDRRFTEESQGAEQILQEDVFGKGIVGVLNVGTNCENSRRCIAQAAKYPRMYAAVGIHPEDCEYLNNNPQEAIDELIAILGSAESRKRDKIVAIGEIGLDYHGENPDKQRQFAFFEAQLCLAEELSLPVIIHDREAHGDCFEQVLRHPKIRGVFHSYSGSAEMALELVRRGWYISFSGVLTFRNARRVCEVAAAIPSDRMLLETDCPYLAPVPFRGRLNHSGLLGYTAQTLADILSLPVERVIEITTENTRTLFQVPNV